MDHNGHEFYVGQRVRIRQWDDMENQYGLTIQKSINCLFHFVQSMKKFCGREFTIKSTDGLEVLFVEPTDSYPYHWSLDMIEPVKEHEDFSPSQDFFDAILT